MYLLFPTKTWTDDVSKSDGNMCIIPWRKVNSQPFKDPFQSYFNGGNATGSVFVDPTDATKFDPSILPQLFPGPVKGRFYFRVDDVVQRGGCSKKVSGTVPLLIYPDIANMLGGVSVDVNGKCWDDEKENYNLFVSERGIAACTRINRAIARCKLPRVQEWGTKLVYFQPARDSTSKAYVGFIYFVPPGIDPMSLDIGNVFEWFENPIKQDSVKPKRIAWFPKNFTRLDYEIPEQRTRENANEIYRVTLDLLVVGYREVDDPGQNKIVPKHKILAKLATFTNDPDQTEQKADFPRLDSLANDIWLISAGERQHDMHTYRVGYFKLVVQRDPEYVAQNLDDPSEFHGLLSAPISLHWLWDLASGQRNSTSFKAEEMCRTWYNHDGTQDNFIRHTETQAPCPCKLEQAKADVARFMPHPRCSQRFRSQYCNVNLGSSDCYMSAENVHYFNDKKDELKPVGTHYGQVCCYDGRGFLMHTGYQPLMQTDVNVPYNPGFPLRANEFGMPPYYGQFEVPVLSAMYHDVMPYFFCCKWTQNKCQFFYWRRPSSGCQEYHPPSLGLLTGSGHFVDLQGEKFTFNEPGIFTLLHIPPDPSRGRAEVNIQVRLERYPNRTRQMQDLEKKYTPPQENLVEPGAGTVLTGVALHEQGSDAVHVLLRKDSRRYKYRTNVIVDGKMRYFDNMWFQRHKGILIYVNVISGMQAEVYIVMEKPQIGLRIREYFGEDIKTPLGNLETRGILDLELSVSPKYMSGLSRTQLDDSVPEFGDREMSGLIFNEGSTNEPELIKKYKVAGWGSTASVYQEENEWSNLFIQTDVLDSKSDPWHTKLFIEEPVYKYARQNEETEEFQALTIENVQAILDTCDGVKEVDSGIKNYYCAEEITRSKAGICQSNKICLYDFVALYDQDVCERSRGHYQAFLDSWGHATRNFNSCAPMNIEFPEYLKMQGSTEAKYLEGNTIHFECYENHWIKGTEKFTCSKHMENGRPVMKWNHGYQPWCRDRKRALIFKWLAGVFGFCMIFLLLIAIFVCCWCCKGSFVDHRKKEEKRRAEEYRMNVFEVESIPKPKDSDSENAELFENAEDCPPDHHVRIVSPHARTISSV